MRELFLAYLAQHDDGAWLRAIDRVAHAIHRVDRTATRIWLHFYPLSLQELMSRPDAADLARRMTLAGRWRLADQVDTSHHFLFGHQYWPIARQVVLDYVDSAAPASLDLGAQIHEISARVAARAGVTADVVAGISAIALRTLQQVGPEAIAASDGTVADPGAYRGRTADQVLARRERAGGRTWLRLFGGSPRQSYVRFDERDAAAQFPIIHSQHLTTAAGLDRRDHRARDPRCSEGPIPVHCRSCSCGTCWVGILAGAEKLSPMDERERGKLGECGVLDANEAPGAPPIIRLSCMTQAEGPVSIVIPPWNGLLGRVLTRAGAGTPSSR